MEGNAVYIIMKNVVDDTVDKGGQGGGGGR